MNYFVCACTYEAHCLYVEKQENERRERGRSMKSLYSICNNSLLTGDNKVASVFTDSEICPSLADDGARVTGLHSVQHKQAGARSVNVLGVATDVKLTAISTRPCVALYYTGASAGEDGDGSWRTRQLAGINGAGCSRKQASNEMLGNEHYDHASHTSYSCHTTSTCRRE